MTEKHITKPCKNCLNEECVWKGTEDNFKLCEDYIVDLSKATNPEFIPRSILEDIKSEIEDEKDFAYADFERYKVECLGQEWEDVLDSLPTDDYRFGMARCLEIIDKHISRKNRYLKDAGNFADNDTMMPAT